jgi:hypothetical protein
MWCGRVGALLLGIIAAAAAFALAALRPHESAATSPALPRAASFSVLQLNLCNSGLARCYAGGRAVPEAADVIALTRPDAVTLDEICRHDLDPLVSTMAAAFPGDIPYSRFQPVYAENGSVFPCRNGDQYGIGIVGHLPANSPGTSSRGGEYPVQDTTSGERRVWECVYAIGSHYVCATHLSADDRGVAMAQCSYLLNTAIPDTRALLGGYFPTVAAGDFNLKYGGAPNVQNCVPAGWSRRGDGDVQHVIATTDYAFVSARKLRMIHTDHPGWLVTLHTP